jgi:SsrA-binding protein
MAILAKNSKAFYDYDFKDTFEAGLVLSGAEVKSAKSGNVSLAGSYVSIAPGSATLINCHIGPYKYAKQAGYDPTHTRKLLLNKQEINSLLGKEKGLTIVPLELFTTGRGLIKLKIGLGRGRKKQDKREYIKKKEISKETRKHIDR